MIKDDRNLAVIAAEKYFSLVKGEKIDSWMGFWDDEAVVEFPFAFGQMQKRLEGKKAIYNYFNNLPEMRLQKEGKVITYPSSDELIAVIETSLEFFIPLTGQEYNQDYVCILKVREDGKITSYREYWNPLVSIKALGRANSVEPGSGEFKEGSK